MHRTAALSALLWIGCGACSADDGGSDDGGAKDAAPDGPLTLAFETVVADLSSQLPVAGVTVTEVGTANATTSAPNGRAILTLSARAPSRVSHELAGQLTNTMAIDPEVLLRHADANQPLSSDVISGADLDALYTGISVTRDDLTTQLVLIIRAADFSAATGVAVTTGGVAFVRGPGGAFELGEAPLSDPIVLVPNLAGASAAVSLSATCAGPTSVPLAPGTIASASYVCDPSI